MSETIKKLTNAGNSMFLRKQCIFEKINKKKAFNIYLILNKLKEHFKYIFKSEYKNYFMV